MMLELWYDKRCLGRIENAFEHQGTWFGDFHITKPSANDPLSLRLAEFIDFCCDWHARAGTQCGADSSEFDAFEDIVHSGRWHTIDENATKTEIIDAPMFMDGRDGEISWITSD